MNDIESSSMSNPDEIEEEVNGHISDYEDEPK